MTCCITYVIMNYVRQLLNNKYNNNYKTAIAPIYS